MTCDDDTCDECGAEADDFIAMADGRFLCRACLWAAAEAARDMREMADDDRAHAERERWTERMKE